MKILFISIESGEVYGGASVALFNNILVLKDHVHIQVLLPGRGILGNKLEDIGVKCHYSKIKYGLTAYPNIHDTKSFMLWPLRFLFRVFGHIWAFYELNKIVHSYKPDIIHTNVGPLLIGAWYSKMKKMPHVWHIREYSKLDFNINVFPSFKYYNKLHRDSYLIAITQGIYDYFRMQTNAELIYDGVVDEKDPVQRNEEIKKQFLFVGAIVPAKGISDLIIAYSKYFEKGGAYKLCVAGDGPAEYVEKMKKLALDLGCSEQITFMGFCFNVFQLMRESCALVVPSINEGFGFITAEAMYNRCIVVGKNTGGTKEQFDNAYVKYNREIGYRFHNIDELIEHLLYLEKTLDIDNLNLRRNLGHDIVCELYSKNRQPLKILFYYNKIYKFK